jgi:hypothetical protein
MLGVRRQARGKEPMRTIIWLLSPFIIAAILVPLICWLTGPTRIDGITQDSVLYRYIGIYVILFLNLVIMLAFLPKIEANRRRWIYIWLAAIFVTIAFWLAGHYLLPSGA